ncbi:AraC family transcriptional regulator [Pedobacter sp. Leaf250]|uniref:helix-turn-helix domain-containing protein n=1 Tax=Pedobacter sp. Leaf250 TaxID=2876559 RepID=UPI001E5EFA48|nr:AraC family transcriptional regulator [Pedobacter sp. Leaf250]
MMINILDEKKFLENLQIGDSFRPDLFSFIVVFGGTIEVESTQSCNIYHKGNIVLIYPEYIYKVKSLSLDIKAFMISFDKDKVRSKISFNFNKYDLYRVGNNERSGNLIFFGEAEFQNIKSVALQLNYYININKTIKFKNELVISLLTTLIYMISGKLLANLLSHSQIDSRKEEITIRFLELVSMHYKNHKDLEFYADQLLISVKYLSNCVRETTQSPPTKFLSYALLNEAKRLLLNSKNPLNIIADDLGFSDQYAFGKFFKKQTGYSPRNFKNHNKLTDNT